MTLGLLMSKEGLERAACAYSPMALRQAFVRQPERFSICNLTREPLALHTCFQTSVQRKTGGGSLTGGEMSVFSRTFELSSLWGLQ